MDLHDFDILFNRQQQVALNNKMSMLYGNRRIKCMVNLYSMFNTSQGDTESVIHSEAELQSDVSLPSLGGFRRAASLLPKIFRVGYLFKPVSRLAARLKFD